MTWEETIEHIRQRPKYKILVTTAYLSSDLVDNVERFYRSIEYKITKKIIRRYNNNVNAELIDIGCGNGISTISFARDNYSVTAIEPDNSDSVGAGAIRSLKEYYKLNNVKVIESYMEDLSIENNHFDIAYVRQAMHHALELDSFLKNISKVLKKGGVLVTIRDHVIFDSVDKKRFLENHPLHKFYGGENAYTVEDYKKAILNAGFEIKETLRYFDSPINYFPTSSFKVQILKQIQHFISKFKFLAPKSISLKIDERLNERNISGRMYSFIAIKK